MPQPTRASATDDRLFDLRWSRAEHDLTQPLARLYGTRTDITGLIERVRALLAQKWAERPDDLRALDLARDIRPDWFLDQRMAGYVFYVDRFAGDMAGVARHIPYLRDLGITYAHFMPCLEPRPGDNDGGYAVMDYRRIDPRLGTMDDFQRVCAEMRAAGISPCIDMVLNHTAREHAWARAAAAGDPHYQDFYLLFDDEAEPLAYERTLLEVFPNQAPGNFTWNAEMNKWVWTTFNTFQWDLNWANPEVFLAILDIVLDLANRGAEVLRLDAVAFMWKRLGTICQNEPEVHDILQAINQAASVAAPAMIFKAEAIVGPQELVPYLGTGRHMGKVCNLAYHNSLMVQFWSALASQQTGMMTDMLARHFPGSFSGAQWATYIRCHDDIGWAITEEDAERNGVTGQGHRRFLVDFYAGRYPGSFARGADFQINEQTGDARTNGTFASLAGLDLALETGNRLEIDRAIERMLLGHALIASFGGMPLIYMGDELGLLNDLSYRDDPHLSGDGRWMHRPQMNWALAGNPAAQDHAARLHSGTKAILAARAALREFSGHVPSRVLRTGHDRIFALLRAGTDATLVALFNFTGEVQEIEASRVGLDIAALPLDALSGRLPQAREDRIVLPAYGRLWLRDPV